jgi:hypothetical protein
MAKKPARKRTTARKPAARKKAAQRTPRMTKAERDVRAEIGDQKVEEIRAFVREITSAGAIVEQVQTRFPDVPARCFQPTVGIMLPR